MSEAKAASGPDFANGVDLDAIPAEGTLAGRVGDEPVLLSRLEGQLYAVGGVCTHYGANLADGLVEGATVRCPLHHACFNLKTGSPRAPALDPLDCWSVELDGSRVFVRQKRSGETEVVSGAHATAGIGKIVIIGGGAAGLACANALRRLGFAGEVTILSADGDPPCDRPNLSKDYLAGTAPEDWLPLRSDEWYSQHAINLQLSTEVTRVDAAAKTVHCSSGMNLPYDKLLIATGSEANRLMSPGFDNENVFTLRSLADARAIAERASPGKHAVVIGGSFIALEAAAALRTRGVEIDVVSPEHVPFERVFGGEVGKHLQALHQSKGVRFHLGSVASGYDGRSVSLPNGTGLEADFVLVGIGVRPRIDAARSAGASVDNGVLVDAFLQTSVPDIYAAGDIAAYPDPATGERVRIEHWAVAERQGEVVAANMLGARKPFDAVPFFWTEQFGTTIRYSGHASRWDRLEIDGDLAGGSFLVRYFADGVHRATASSGRDLANLEDELKFEIDICAKGGDARDSQ